MAGVPYVQLSGFYLFYFATLGAVLPYWGLYLRENGYSATQIGIVFAALMGTKVIAPYVWGWLADHHGKRIYIIRSAAVLTLLAFMMVPFADSFIIMALLMTAYGFFWNAALPQVEVLTFNHLGANESHYGRIRLWGSVGFILSVIALGWVLEVHGLSLLPLWIMASLSGVVVMTVLLRERAQTEVVHHSGGLWQTVRRPEVLCLLLACLLVQLSHGPYYTFFSIYLEDHGYARGHIGLLWSLGVIAEIGVFLAMPWLSRRLGMRKLFMLALVVTILRWLLLAEFVNSIVAIVIVQLMHMMTFGLYHAVAVNLIHRMFKGRLQGRGQALYSSMSFGIGGGLGSLISGYLWDYTSPSVIYFCAAASALLAWWLCWKYLHVTEDTISERPAVGVAG